MADYDTTGWTVYEPAKCECIEAQTGKIDTPGGIKPVIILTMFCHEHDREMVYFCNAIKAKVSKKNYSVMPNSNFAKLYRITTGKNPRFSKSQQLMKHFIGEWFHCEYCQSISKNGLPYFKVTSIKPLEPKTDKKWLPGGRLIKGRKQQNEGDKSQHPNGNDLAPDWQLSGTDLAPQPDENPDPERDESQNELHKNISLAGVDAYKHVPITPISEFVNEHGARERVFHVERMEGENDDEYFQRVIDASW